MIKPLKDKIFLEILSDDRISKGGILLADTIKDIPRRGKVIAAGANFKDYIQKNDIVHFKRTWTKFVDINEKKCAFLTKEEIIGIERPS